MAARTMSVGLCTEKRGRKLQAGRLLGGMP
jgi:hypothetical protein